MDGFNDPTYTEADPVQVANVLIAPVSDSDIVENTALDNAKAIYTLAIPKGDTHNWEDAIVEFWGERWHVTGIPSKGIEENIPLSWNLKVTVERYE